MANSATNNYESDFENSPTTSTAAASNQSQRSVMSNREENNCEVRGNNDVSFSQTQNSHESPRTRSKRIRSINRHLGSSSLRRRIYKPVHCKFCCRYKGSPH